MSWLFIVFGVLFIKGVEGVNVHDLITDQLEVSKASNQIVSNDVSTASNTGWFSEIFYSESNCAGSSLYVTDGVITNQCLFSRQQQVYFAFSCTSNEAFLSYYSDPNCSNNINVQTLPLNSCLSSHYGIFSYQCTTSQSEALALPTSKNLVLYQYYEDDTCSNIIQYTGYVESICLAQNQDQSISFHYPEKKTYQNRNCQGSGTSTSLQVNTCFDWVAEYGYGSDNGLNAYDPYLVISYWSAGSSSPSVTPSLRPSMTPTISIAPSHTASPSALPTISPTNTASPTAAPSISFGPTYSMKPTSAAPSKKPTPSPFRGSSRSPTQSIDYQITYSVTQVLSNTDCSTLQNNAVVLTILSESVKLTLENSLTSNLINDVTAFTTIADSTGSCSLTYNVTIPSILSAGFTTPLAAYDTTTGELATSIQNGDWARNWAKAAAAVQASTLVTASTASLSFGSYSTASVSSSPSGSSGSSSSSSSSPSAGAIAAAVILSVCFGTVFLQFLFRWIYHNRNKVSCGSDNDVMDNNINGTIELAQASYLEGTPRNLANPVMDDRRLPQARPVPDPIVTEATPV